MEGLGLSVDGWEMDLEAVVDSKQSTEFPSFGMHLVRVYAARAWARE